LVSIVEWLEANRNKHTMRNYCLHDPRMMLLSLSMEHGTCARSWCTNSLLLLLAFVSSLHEQSVTTSEAARRANTEPPDAKVVTKVASESNVETVTNNNKLIFSGWNAVKQSGGGGVK
jgi:hypothetical protein